MAQVERFRQAEEDLLAIAQYIAKNNPMLQRLGSKRLTKPYRSSLNSLKWVKQSITFGPGSAASCMEITSYSTKPGNLASDWCE